MVNKRQWGAAGLKGEMRKDVRYVARLCRAECARVGKARVPSFCLCMRGNRWVDKEEKSKDREYWVGQRVVCSLATDVARHNCVNVAYLEV